MSNPLFDNAPRRPGDGYRRGLPLHEQIRLHGALNHVDPKGAYQLNDLDLREDLFRSRMDSQMAEVNARQVIAERELQTQLESLRRATGAMRVYSEPGMPMLLKYLLQFR